MNTLKTGMNKSWPNRDGAVSARGMAKILDKIAKAEGRGKDLLIDPGCTIHDIARAYMQIMQDEMLSSLNTGLKWDASYDCGMKRWRSGDYLIERVAIRDFSLRVFSGEGISGLGITKEIGTAKSLGESKEFFVRYSEGRS